MRKSIIRPMTNPITNQKGLTLISWLVIIVFLLFQIVIAMNVLPVYMTDHSVKQVMAALSTDNNLKGLTPYNLKNVVAKRLSINSIYTVTAKHISIKSGRGEHVVIIEYEPRGKLIGNLEYIVHFRHEAKVSARN